MAAYNDVNGVPATEQDELNNGVLKGEWGWDGLLMSDWFATKTAAPAANGGLDLVMPGPGGPWGTPWSRRSSRGGPVSTYSTTMFAASCGSPPGRRVRSPRSWPGVPARQPARREQLTRFAAAA